MIIDRRSLAGLLGLAMMVAACGGSAAPSASEAPGASQAPAATETLAPTEAPATEAPAVTEPPAPSQAPGGDSGGAGPVNDLAARLPEKVGDVTFERVGFDGSQFGMYGAMAGLSDADLNGVLADSGKTLADVNFAMATASGDQQGFVYAIQVEGLGTEQLMTAFGFDSADMQQANIAGKDVHTTGVAGLSVTSYAKDDTLYLILFTTPGITQGILEQLP